VRDEAIAAAISELATLAERARRASETTRQLAEDYGFIIAWYGARPHPGLRTLPVLDNDRAKDVADMALSPVILDPSLIILQ
jgi:hypothetical protein